MHPASPTRLSSFLLTGRRHDQGCAGTPPLRPEHQGGLVGKPCPGRDDHAGSPQLPDALNPRSSPSPSGEGLGVGACLKRCALYRSPTPTPPLKGRGLFDRKSVV